MQFFDNPNYDFIKWRWHAIALSAARHPGRPRPDGRARRPAARHRLLGRHDRRREVRPGRVRGAGARRGRRPARREGRPDLRQRRRPSRSSSACRRPARKRASTSSRAPSRSSRRSRRRTSASSRCCQTEVVGPVIGADLQRKGIYATFASILGITAYIALRFRPSFAAGAIVATFHDILVTVAFLSFFGYELSLNVVAALLTITGYSVNDTIVIFDRVRENFGKMRRELARAGRQHQRQPDAGPDGHHRRHDVPVGARALPVRRRGARRASPSRCSSASSAAPTRRCSSRPPSPSSEQGQGKSSAAAPRLPARRRPRRRRPLTKSGNNKGAVAR